jgi:HEAT repeat protein
MVRVNALSRLEVVAGELRIEVAEGRVREVLPLLIELGRRLSQPLDVAQRLAEGVVRHPLAPMRLRNLVLLVRECAWDERTAETLRKASMDPSPEVRLRAALELGAEGRGVLRELAEAADDDEVAAQALALVGRELPLAKVEAALIRALRHRHLKTARVSLEVLGESGDPAAGEILAKVLSRETGELAAAAAMALAATGSPAAEPPLILALERDAQDLRVAVAQALGRVGTVAAIPPLKEAAGQEANSPEARQAIRQAIAEIRSRLPGASPGQLSLAETEAGQLSLAETEAGRLSLASDPAGRVSLSTERPRDC